MTQLYLLLILLIGAFTRFYNNTAVSLWHDEAFSALYIRYPWQEMIRRIILDVHPPLYYFLLRFWSYVFGQGLFSLRFFSILFGLLTIWAGYLFVKQIFSEKSGSPASNKKAEYLALFAALMIALNPFQAQYSLEARMYTLGTFLILFSSYLLLKALETNYKKYWFWYGLFIAAALYTHYYLVFSVMAQGLYIIFYLIKTKKISFTINSPLVRALASYIFGAILFLPWLKPFLRQLGRVEASYWIPPMDRWSIPGTIWKMVFGGQGINRFMLTISVLLTIFLIFYFFRKIKQPEKWLILFSVLIPFLAAVLLSFKTAIYLDRYFVFTSLFFVILIAIAFWQIPQKRFKQIIILFLILSTVFAFFKNWSDLEVKNLFFDRNLNKKPGMAAAAEYINERALKNDKIYFGSTFIFFTFKYYNRTNIPPLLYSTGSLETIPHFSGTALLSNEDLIMNFNATQKNANVWLVWTTGWGGSKPNVPGNWSVVSEKSFDDTPGFKGTDWVTLYHVN